MGSRFAIVAALFCLVGCGSSASDSGGKLGGWYDPKIGQVLPELDLWGYVRTDATGLANDAVLGPVSFDSIRQSTNKTHALIHVSGFT